MFRPTVHGCEAIKSIHTSESVRTNWRWDIWIYSFCFHIFSQRRKSISTPISNGHECIMRKWESIHKPKNMKSHFSVFPIWISLNVLWAMSSKGIIDSRNEKKQIELNEKKTSRKRIVQKLYAICIYIGITRKNVQCSFHRNHLWFLLHYICLWHLVVQLFFGRFELSFFALSLLICASHNFCDGICHFQSETKWTPRSIRCEK